MDCEIKNLNMSYGENVVFNNVNMYFEKGKIHAIVGERGSGKTTLLKLFLGIEKPKKGSLQWGTIPGQKKGQAIHFGAMINSPIYSKHKSGLDNLIDLSDIRKVISEIDVKATMKDVRLPIASKMEVGNYTPDMMKRLHLAQAIMENQPIIILDNLFRHIELKNKQLIKNVIYNCMCSGRTIILTLDSEEEALDFSNYIYKISEKKLLEI